MGARRRARRPLPPPRKGSTELCHPARLVRTRFSGASLLAADRAPGAGAGWSAGALGGIPSPAHPTWAAQRPAPRAAAFAMLFPRFISPHLWSAACYPPTFDSPTPFDALALSLLSCHSTRQRPTCVTACSGPPRDHSEAYNATLACNKMGALNRQEGQHSLGQCGRTKKGWVTRRAGEGVGCWAPQASGQGEAHRGCLKGQYRLQNQRACGPGRRGLQAWACATRAVATSGLPLKTAVRGVAQRVLRVG